MIIGRTTRELPLNLWGVEAILPAGTQVHLVEGASGTRGNLWAVSSEPLLIELSGGNTHDPKYRYAFVPEDAVEMTTSTVTGRLTNREPELQNLPGTLAHRLEMYWARHARPASTPATRRPCAPRSSPPARR